MQALQEVPIIKRLLSVVLVITLVLTLAPSLSSQIAFADETDYSSLIFDPESTYIGETTLAGNATFPETLVYKTYLVESYVTNPVQGMMWGTTPSANFFRMYIHVAVSYGEEVFNPYSMASAPIMFKVNWGGDSSTAPGQTSATSDNILRQALTEGWVVVNPGMLGNNCTSTGPNGETDYNYGVAPYPVASLKAAIRYLRYDTNATTIPGDKEKIFATGTSSGGCGTVMLAASGNSTLFNDALDDLGAAPGRDDIFGTHASCPIVPRDYSDDAVAWLRFWWLDFDSVDTTGMSDKQLQGLEINRGLVESFKDYVPGLGLRANYSAGSVTEGDLITADNMLEYFYPYLKSSCIDFLNARGSRAAIDTYLATKRGNMTRSTLIRPVYAENGETVVDLEGTPEEIWRIWIDYVYQVAGFGGMINGTDPTVVDHLYDKPYLSPNIQENGVLLRADQTGFTTAGSRTFGKATDWAAAYSPFGLSWITDPDHQGVTVSQEYYDLYDLQCKSLDPLYFISNAEELGVTVAPNWFIRTGAADTVALPAMFLSLTTGLENNGHNVNSALTWDQGHGATSEWKQFFDWSDDLIALKIDIDITNVTVGNKQANLDFGIASANGNGYKLYLSETSEYGPFVEYGNVNYNAKGIHVKNLTNGQLYYMYVTYEDGSGTVLRSAVVEVTPNK